MNEFVQKYTDFSKPLEKAIFLDYPHNVHIMDLKFSSNDRYVVVATCIIPRVNDFLMNIRMGRIKIEDVNLKSMDMSETCYGYNDNGEKIYYNPVGTPEEYALKVWDAYTGECIRTLPHEEWLMAIKYSPDGTMLAAGGLFGTLKIWDTHTWECKHELKGVYGHIKSLDFSSTGDRLFTVSTDYILRVWDTQTGECISDTAKHKGMPNFVVCHPHKEQCITVGENGSVIIWDTSTMTCIRTWCVEPKYPSMEYENRNRILHPYYGYGKISYKAGYVDNGMRFYTIKLANEYRQVYDIKTNECKVVYNTGVDIWDAENLEYIETLESSKFGLYSGTLEFSPSDAAYAVAVEQGLLVWDMEEDRKIKTLSKGRGKVQFSPYRVAYNHAGDAIAGGYYNGTVRIWRVKKPKEEKPKKPKKTQPE